MSPLADSQPELPAEELLVAYLDGELPPEDCRRVEARIAADPEYRRKLRELDQTWEALDALPVARPGNDFARTTMEMVAVAAESDASQHAARASSASHRRLAWAALLGIATVIAGFALTRLLMSSGDRATLAALPAIRQADLLMHVESIDFLRRLPEVVPLDQLASDETALQEEMRNLVATNAPTHRERRQWIDSLNQEQKTQLLGQVSRFRELSPEQRERVLTLQREIEQAPDAEALQRSFLAYGQWLSRFTLGEQEEIKVKLQNLSADEQADEVRRYIRLENQRTARQLSAEDVDVLRKTILTFVEERRTRLMRDLRGRGSSERARRLEGTRGALMILGWALQNEETSGELRDHLVRQLSPEAQAYFDRLGRGSRRVQLWQWIRDALQPKWGPGELERFFAEKLDNNQRERLLNLPSGQMQAELERLYVASELGPDDPGGPIWFSPGPGPPSGPPREGIDRNRIERDPDVPPRNDRGRPGSRGPSPPRPEPI